MLATESATAGVTVACSSSCSRWCRDAAPVCSCSACACFCDFGTAEDASSRGARARTSDFFSLCRCDADTRPGPACGVTGAACCEDCGEGDDCCGTWLAWVAWSMAADHSPGAGGAEVGLVSGVTGKMPVVTRAPLISVPPL